MGRIRARVETTGFHDSFLELLDAAGQSILTFCVLLLVRDYWERLGLLAPAGEPPDKGNDGCGEGDEHPPRDNEGVFRTVRGHIGDEQDVAQFPITAIADEKELCGAFEIRIGPEFEAAVFDGKGHVVALEDGAVPLGNEGENDEQGEGSGGEDAKKAAARHAPILPVRVDERILAFRIGPARRLPPGQVLPTPIFVSCSRALRGGDACSGINSCTVVSPTAGPG